MNALKKSAALKLALIGFIAASAVGCGQGGNEFDVAKMGQMILNREPRFVGYFDFQLGSTKISGEVNRPSHSCEEVTQPKLIVRCRSGESFFADVFGTEDPKTIITLIDEGSVVIRTPSTQPLVAGSNAVSHAVFEYRGATVSVVHGGPSGYCADDYEWELMPSGKAAYYCVDKLITLVRTTTRAVDLVLEPRTAKILEKLTAPTFELDSGG